MLDDKAWLNKMASIVQTTGISMISGAFYATIMASINGLIGTPTARRMMIQSVRTFGFTGGLFAVSREALTDIYNHHGHDESVLSKQGIAVGSGCVAGLAVGMVNGGTLPGTVGTCLGLGTVAAFLAMLDEHEQQWKTGQHKPVWSGMGTVNRPASEGK